MAPTTLFGGKMKLLPNANKWCLRFDNGKILKDSCYCLIQQNSDKKKREKSKFRFYFYSVS